MAAWLYHSLCAPPCVHPEREHREHQETGAPELLGRDLVMQAPPYLVITELVPGHHGGPGFPLTVHCESWF